MCFKIINFIPNNSQNKNLIMTINHKFISSILVLLAIISFFLGFSLDEISMGAGGYDGDFVR